MMSASSSQLSEAVEDKALHSCRRASVLIRECQSRCDDYTVTCTQNFTTSSQGKTRSYFLHLKLLNAH